jgi:hypothetical protein
MRRLRDRPRCRDQLHAFNTAAGGKINADKRPKVRGVAFSVTGYGKTSL